MSSPLEIWERFLRVDELDHPGDACQLEVVCCEASERVVSHIGIQYGNCVFQSDVLLKLCKKYGRDGALSVEIRANDRASQIWVRDPGSRDWIEILNQDPETRDLTFAQVSLLEKIRRLESPGDKLISRVQARLMLKELAQRAQAKKTIKGLPRLLRILGIDDLDARNELTQGHLRRIKAEPTVASKAPRDNAKKAPDAKQQAPEPAPRAKIQREPIPAYEVVKGVGGDVR